MHLLTVEAPTLLDALQPVLATVDACWWWLGGEGHQVRVDLVSRFKLLETRPFELAPQLQTQYGQHGIPLTDQEAHLAQWLDDYVKESSNGVRCGIPGYFRRLGDCVDHCWATFFAIEGAKLPATTLEWVENERGQWCPTKPLLPDVLLVVSYVDMCLQQFAFREVWIYEQVLQHAQTNGWQHWPSWVTDEQKR